MAVTFNERSVDAQSFGVHAYRQRLLTEARVRGARVLLDRWTLGPGAVIELGLAEGELAWLQVLDGEAVLSSSAGSQRLSADNVAFLPPGFLGALTAHNEATVLYAEVPDATRFDPQLAAQAPRLRVVDWTREPVLDSEHDARKRIYLVTPKLSGTRAIKGEMIIYPPGTECPNHHHEGAAHFMYVLAGSGTAWANERPFQVKKGDLVWYDDCERHYLRSDPLEGMRFVEYFVPGECTTIWAPGAQVCTWRPTGKDIRGGAPAREISRHSSQDFAIPGDV
ncbi:MAG TPA: cupin domain-containing protein [Burkholderiales bacterium]|nr:cupin domain-containing protein [Burkholderiales bacterium]